MPKTSLYSKTIVDISVKYTHNKNKQQHSDYSLN